MPLPLTISCSSKIQIGFTFLVPAHPGSPGQRAVKRVCVCVYLLIPVIKQYTTHLHWHLFSRLDASIFFVQISYEAVKYNVISVLT